MGAKNKHEPRILVLDIEATNLNATFGVILCIGWKWYGEKRVHVPSIIDASSRNMLDDKELVRGFLEGPYTEADWVITWYGDRYDLPMLKTRAIKHGLRPPPPVYSLDLYRHARRHFKVHSNRLAVWQEFLKTADAKTKIDLEAWQYAAMGHRAAMKIVTEHCKADVLVLDEVYTRFRPWLAKEPAHNHTLIGRRRGDNRLVCPSCGSTHVELAGHRRTIAGVYQRYRCLDCGRWSRGRTADALSNLRSTE